MKKKFVFPGKFALGILMYISLNSFIAWGIFPYLVIIYRNIFLNILAIFLVSILIRYSMIVIYDYLKFDWFFIEEIKKQEELRDKKKNRIIKKIEKYKALGNMALMIMLVMTDSVITVLYYRPDSFRWNGLEGKKTKALFILSNILGALIAGLGYNFFFYILKKTGFF